NVVGDMNIRSFFSSVVLLLNRQMITEYGLEDPFTLVREDRWTIDKLTEYASAVTLDLDGDGTVGIEDSAGFFGEDVSLLWGLNSMNIQTISNVDGTPVITLNTEQTVTGIEKYVHLIRSSETGIYASTVSAKYTGENIWRTRMLPMLMNDQLLFYNSTIGTSLDLRVMDSDFGIIPMPKYDEKQEQYYASTHPAYLSFVTIPTSNPEPERTGTILEAVNAYSMEYVVPAVYQTTLVGKVIRDVESEEMLDIIFANRVYDIGYLFNWGDMSIFVSNFSQQNNTNFASGFAKSESKFQADIDKYLAAHPKE
ncbi:MAG: hypothetical protein IJX14_06430, partial [Clostridia bacterium]|nr:hypothetical protein [Clostridia bacterium]